MRLIEPMDAESAIRVLEMAVTYNGCGRATSDDLAEALKLAKEALEKQIPTRPTVSYHKYLDADTNKEGSYHLTHCPCCFFDHHLGYFESLIDKGTAFCRRCGQAIDWKEGEADV